MCIENHCACDESPIVLAKQKLKFFQASCSCEDQLCSRIKSTQPMPSFPNWGPSPKVVSNITTRAVQPGIFLSLTSCLYLVSKSFNVSIQNKMFSFSMGRGCWWNRLDSCCVSSAWLIRQRVNEILLKKIWFQVLSNVKKTFLGGILITVKNSYCIFEKGPVDISIARRHLWSSNSMQLEASSQR